MILLRQETVRNRKIYTLTTAVPGDDDNNNNHPKSAPKEVDITQVGVW